MHVLKLLVFCGLSLSVSSLTLDWHNPLSKKKAGNKHRAALKARGSEAAVKQASEKDGENEVDIIGYDGKLFKELKDAVRAKKLELFQLQAEDPIHEFRPRAARVPTRNDIDPKRRMPGQKLKGIEVFWQRPRGEVKGVFFAATGCFHQGGDFFKKVGPDGYALKECRNTNLKTCQGLPESVYMFKYARRRGYLVMSATPDAKNSCWEHKNDASRVRDALDYVLAVEGLPSDTPMFATGASQGGYFMFDLQAHMGGNNLKCIAPQCAEIKNEKDVNLHYGGEHLPTMFIYMPLREKHSECPKVPPILPPGQEAPKCSVNIVPMIHRDIAYLRKKGVKVAERSPDQWPFHLLLQARGYDNVTVAKVKTALAHAKGKFGHKPVTKDGRILDHPGEEWWINPIRPHVDKHDRIVKDHSPIHQMMQVAYAEHEITAEYTDHIIDFCEGHEDPHAPLRWGRKPNVPNPTNHPAKMNAEEKVERYYAPTPVPDGLETPRLISDSDVILAEEKGRWWDASDTAKSSDEPSETAIEQTTEPNNDDSSSAATDTTEQVNAKSAKKVSAKSAKKVRKFNQIEKETTESDEEESSSTDAEDQNDDESTTAAEAPADANTEENDEELRQDAYVFEEDS